MTITVFISGANGFIAQHTIQLLLSQGYLVVGSVRTDEKGEHLKKLFKSDFFSYEIVPSLMSETAFQNSLQKHPEVTVFLHMASPVILDSKNVENELLKPAVKGTENALKCIMNYGPQIKNVVITSSVAAMVTVRNMNNPEFSVDERAWNSATWAESKVNSWSAYAYSKTEAEKVAWTFMESEKPDFTLNVVCPVYAFGPQAFDSEVKYELNASAEIINQIFKLSSHSQLPLVEGAFVDVRDVARAHLVAFSSNLKNKRLILCTEEFTSQKIIDVLRDAFLELRDRLPKGNPGTGDKANFCIIDHKQSREILGYQQMDLTTSIVDAVAQLLRVERVKRISTNGFGSAKFL